LFRYFHRSQSSDPIGCRKVAAHDAAQTGGGQEGGKEPQRVNRFGITDPKTGYFRGKAIQKDGGYSAETDTVKKTSG
jgi:hypothetical protein